jgi:hypothetical protein
MASAALRVLPADSGAFWRLEEDLAAGGGDFIAFMVTPTHFAFDAVDPVGCPA